ncbi:MAG: hypothetical protein B7733_20810 [Myxococcales bacterium FL481]|nr:MAG: hypothetical protein B7733_20810 [Myxococcales bacterium FL481]
MVASTDESRESGQILKELRRLSNLRRQLTLPEAYRVGELLAALTQHQAFAHYDDSLWFREVHRTLDTGFSVTSLCRYHHVHSMLKRLGLEPQFEHLGMAHLRVVAMLPTRRQRAVIRRAEKERWTSRRLEKLLDEEGLRTRDRRRVPDLVRQIRDLRKFTSPTLGDLARGDGLASLDDELARELADILLATETQAKRLRKRLDRRLRD